eukprot:SAG31_NODE_35787_length_319_cov_32.713636_1_plen_66_part_01
MSSSLPGSLEIRALAGRFQPGTSAQWYLRDARRHGDCTYSRSSWMRCMRLLLALGSALTCASGGPK